MQNDLDAFRLLYARRSERPYTVRGTASGGSLQGQVVDHSGGTVLSKTYSGSTRDNAHQFANDIIETLTGHKGIAGTARSRSSPRAAARRKFMWRIVMAAMSDN